MMEKAKIIKNGNTMIENIIIDNPKKAIRSGELKIGNLIIKVHVLNTGERVIEEDSVIKFIKWLEEGHLTQEEADKFTKDLNSF